jgi:hypothetical protein
MNVGDRVRFLTNGGYSPDEYVFPKGVQSNEGTVVFKHFSGCFGCDVDGQKTEADDGEGWTFFPREIEVIS